MTYINPLLNQMPPLVDPMYGGSLGTGPTGLPGLMRTGVPTNTLPFAAPSLAQQAGNIPSAYQAARSSLPGFLGASKAAGSGALARGGAWGAKAAAPMISGLAAQAAFGSEDEGILQQAGRGFVSGAGWGLPAAAAVGAIPGVNLVGVPLVAAAAGITGAAGAALDLLDAGDWFKGDDGDTAVEAEEILATAIQQANIDPEMTAEILDTYEVLITMAGAEEDEGQRKMMEQEALKQAGQMVLGAMQQRDQATSAASNTLALQQQSQEIFQPLADDIRQSGAAYAQAMEANRQYLPESYRPFADMDVAREMHSSNKLADAYMAQAAVTPAVNQLTQYQQDFQGYAAQLFAQQMAQQAAGATAGGAQDILALHQPGA